MLIPLSLRNGLPSACSVSQVPRSLPFLQSWGGRGQKGLAMWVLGRGGVRVARAQRLPAASLASRGSRGQAWTCLAVGSVISFISSQPRVQINAPVLALPPPPLGRSAGQFKEGSGVHS